MARTGPSPVGVGQSAPKTTEEGELGTQVRDKPTPSQASGSGGGRRTKSLADKLGGQGEFGHTLQGGKSPEGKGEKRNGQQAELECPQTLGGGKKIKRPDGSSIKLPELSPKGNSSKQTRKARAVEEPSGIKQAKGGVALGRLNDKGDTSEAWILKLWPSQTTAEGADKEQVSAKRKVADPRLSAAKLQPWDGLTSSLKLEKTPAQIRKEPSLPDEKALLEVRKQAWASPLVQK